VNALAIAITAPVAGSFVGCAALRLGDGRRLWGPSACPHCGRDVGLVPLLSWMVGGARCAGCAAPVPAYYPLIELAALALAAPCLGLDGWRVWAGCGLAWSLLLLVLVDLRRQRLPDAVTLPLLGAGLAVVASYQPERLVDHLAAAAGGWLAFALLAASYRRWRGREGLGGGDAKLLAAAGAWVGPAWLAWVVVLAAAAGLAWALARGGWDGARRLPFGPFLAAAAYGVWLWAGPP
jgi:leader peptidase (prepilin peptidase)/N-methyltransferase